MKKALGLFGKEKDLTEMSSSEKEGFLSNDLIERMIRVEQRVSCSFGETVPYFETQYYRGLSDNEKTRFDDYLKKKDKKKLLFFLPLFFLILVFSFSGFRITGNVIGSGNEIGLSFYILILVFLFTSLIFVIYSLRKSLGKKKFESHFKILDSIGVGRYFR